MPAWATAIPAIASLAGGLLSGGSKEGSRNTSTNSSTNQWGKSDTSQSSSSRREYEYMPTLTEDEKLALWTKAKDRINKSWLSGQQGTSESLAARGLQGGPAVKAFAAGDRARNEALSGAATDIEIEGAKKLQKAVSDYNQSYGTSYNQQQGTSTGTGDMDLYGGSAQNQLGGMLSGLGGYGLTNSKFQDWLSNLFK